MRLLTKSRFKLGLECPNKLYYTKKKEYANQKNDNPFLEALASGGFQVEELAKLHYPDGILIEDKKSHSSYDYEEKVEATNKLLQRVDVVIFEAAFLFDNLFIRVDILEKKGKQINLIEVKSKSFNSSDCEFEFVGKKGGLDTSWAPYLFDVAFQKYVIEKAFPEFKVIPFLMLADKDKTTSLDGLNQLFRITKSSDNRTGVEPRLFKLNKPEEESVLSTVNVSSLIEGIESGNHRIIKDCAFEDSIKFFAKAYQDDRFFDHDLNFQACKACEFKTKEDIENLRSGFKECFAKKMDWNKADFKKPHAFEIWNLHYTKRNKLQELGLLKLEDIDDELLRPKTESKLILNGMSSYERQLIQKHKAVDNDLEPEVLKDSLKAEIDSWTFPLNFIDFEASTSALPFYAGQKPYEKVVFQFSHHIYHENGKIEHANEYINLDAGVFPNFEFVRELKMALEQNTGTVFQFSPYENSTLNQLKIQLDQSNETDKNELITFIKSLTTPPKSKDYKDEIWEPSRGMIDLCEVIKAYYYNPLTKGSNSIKAILPAILETSQFIKTKYSKPISDIEMNSFNFSSEKVWLTIEDGKVVDPYKSLEKPFQDWDEDFERVSDIEDINNGGAAMTAYGLTQYTDMSDEEREKIKSALLKYCELDTLAMVMVYEHLRETIS
ncbi:DUF2779 domain-containing protein [uncultured Arcticibacterium sp.]|uniref:DUF2779 domain-containing protein n=1 Tax=uncultured Arcticibacterium sp. TaxID=2173042 RepID=UPI0030FC81D0